MTCSRRGWAGFSCGADDFLAKPFDLDELLQKVTEHIA
jgi:DNA-binding response OmpR family regulator